MSSNMNAEYVTKLEERLKIAENNLYFSARHGKDLLDQNVELKEKLQFQIDKNRNVEALEQERYSLKNQLDASRSYGESLHEDLEYVREQWRKDACAKEQEANKASATQVEHIKELEADIEEAKQREEGYKTRVNELEAQMDSFLKSTECENTMTQHALLEDALHELQSDVQRDKEQEETLLKLIEKKDETLEQVQGHVRQLESRIKPLERELEEKECQITSYCNTLDKYHEEIMELQAEMQVLHLRETDPSRRGNSLFSEVEDHRQRLEKHVISLRTKYDAICRENAQNLQRISNLQLQVSSLAAAASTKAKVSYVEELEQKLSQAQAELRTVVALQANRGSVNPLVPHDRPNDGHGDGYLKVMLAKSQMRCAEVEKECKVLKFKCMTESEQERQARHQLFKTEQRAEVLWAENLKLKVQLEGIQRKYGENKENVVLKVVENIKVDKGEVPCETRTGEKAVKVKEEPKTGESQPVKTTSTKAVSFAPRHSSTSGEQKQLITGQQPRIKMASRATSNIKVITVSKEQNECNQQ